MTTRTICTLLLLIALVGAATARADDGFATGPLGPYLLLGDKGIWHGALQGNAYSLSNESDANSTNSLFVDPRGGGTTAWDISVEVQVGDMPGGIAGLLYGRQEEEPPFYLAFVIDTHGTASILQRNPGGLERLVTFEKAQLIEGGFNTLRIVEDAGQFEVFVNGTRVGTAKTGVAGTGAVGIIAGGKGHFLFRNFALVPVPGSTPVAAATPPEAAEPAGTLDAAEAATAPPEGTEPVEPGPEAADPAVPDVAAAEPVEPEPVKPEPAAAALPATIDDGLTALDDIGYSTDTALPTEPPPLAAIPAAPEPPIELPPIELPLVDLPLPPERPAEFE